MISKVDNQPHAPSFPHSQSDIKDPSTLKIDQLAKEVLFFLPKARLEKIENCLTELKKIPSSNLSIVTLLGSDESVFQIPSALLETAQIPYWDKFFKNKIKNPHLISDLDIYKESALAIFSKMVANEKDIDDQLSARNLIYLFDLLVFFEDKIRQKNVEKSLRLMISKDPHHLLEMAYAASESSAKVQEWVLQELFQKTDITFQKIDKEKIKNFHVFFENNFKKNEKDLFSSCILGQLCMYGLGVENDQKKAVEYFQLGAKNKYSLGECNLGYCLENGIGIKKDRKKALQLYKQAAERGCTLGQYLYGHSMEYAPENEVNMKTAVHYYTLAAKSDFPPALLCLGSYHHENIHEKPDLTKAYFYFHAASQHGYPLAQYQVAVFLEKGTIVKKDIAEAIKFYKLAANQDNIAALYHLGICYQYGKGLEKDFTQAFKYYQRGAELKYSPALFATAYCYQHGMGTEKNLEKGFEYYLQAAEQNYALAQFNIGYCLHHGNGTQKDVKKALKYYQLAAAQGEPNAKKVLQSFNAKQSLGTENSIEPHLP